MRRLFIAIWDGLSSRILPPLVVGFFLLIYIGIVFFTDEALVALMEFTRRSIFIAALLALLPLNSAIRIVKECGRSLKIRRALNGRSVEDLPDLFDEAVVLSSPSSFTELDNRLGGAGYKTRRTGAVLAAWRGISIIPARVLFLAGTFCLFAGILISLTTRESNRGSIIEGEPLPSWIGGGKVESIVLGTSRGAILSKTLVMEVSPPDSTEKRRVFGLYPPDLYRGAFVYPRYLGIGLLVRFLAPDLPGGFEKHCVLNVYPPGKEDSVEITNSSYRIIFSLAAPADGSDPYATGRMTFLFKVQKGKEVLFTGSAPTGGEFVHDGFRVAIPDSRRLVITDFIKDYGVLLIWTAAVLFIIAGSIWLSARILFPRREMLFIVEPNVIQAYFRAEGGGKKHAEVFHDALDLIEARRSTNP